MLSDAIRELARTFREYEHTGIQMAPEAVTSHRRMLATWAADVRELENRKPGAAARLAAIEGDNVVRFRRNL